MSSEVTSAIALISEGRVLVSNTPWSELDQTGRRAWRRSSPPGRGRARSLASLALAEARALAGAGQAVRVVRLEGVGGQQTVELRLERLSSPHGLTMVLVVARDVSRDARAQEVLSRVREALGARERLVSLGQLVSGVAHDLSNTLGAMRFRLQLLATEPGLVLRHGRNLEALQQIVADATARVGRLHEFVRPRNEVALERVELTRVVGDAIELARTGIERDRAGAAGVRIEAEVDELPPVRGCAAELRHMLINLLLNARDAMPGGGCIRVLAGVSGAKVRVRIEDEGTGIPAEILDRIFEPFFTTKGSRGSGLGLAMARELMQRLGGSITAANRAGGGAVFTLTFPVYPEPRAQGSGASSGSTQPPRAASPIRWSRS